MKRKCNQIKIKLWEENKIGRTILNKMGPTLKLNDEHWMHQVHVAVIVRSGKKNPNPLAHPNPLTNCPTKPTYLINGQMGASPIRPN